jgi:hypothetical protein
VHYERDADGIVTLTLDDPSSSANAATCAAASPRSASAVGWVSPRSWSSSDGEAVDEPTISGDTSVVEHRDATELAKSRGACRDPVSRLSAATTNSS